MVLIGLARLLDRRDDIVRSIDVLDDHNVPYSIVPGNHDYRNDFRSLRRALRDARIRVLEGAWATVETPSVTEDVPAKT